MSVMNHAIILAGGKGERLRPHSENCPKPMVPVYGKPLLAHNVNWLVAHGFNRITICCSYKPEVIIEYFGDGSKFSAAIDYCIETQPLGRGGAIKAAMNKIGQIDKPILALNGDIFTNLNLHDLVARHMKQIGALATIVSVPLVSQYGIIDIEENGIVSGFLEKPELPFWINAGIYIFEPALKDLLPDVGDHEDTTFPILAKASKLRAYRAKVFWRAVDTVKDLTELNAACERMFFESFLQQSASLVNTF